MPFIPGVYLWGRGCKQTLLLCSGTCRGDRKAKGHLCSWEGTWGQSRGLLQRPLSPKGGGPPGACPSGLPGSGPGCALCQAGGRLPSS